MTKLFKYIGLTLLLMTFTSCSNEDSDDTSSINSGNYFPLTIDNYWNYNITNTNLSTSQAQNTLDSLYVNTANNNAFGLAVNGIATGTMNTILTQTQLTRTLSTLSGTGSITFPFQGLEDIQIGLTDMIFYDLNSNVNETLSSINGTIEQTIEGLPITVEFTLTTRQGAFSETLFLNSMNYEDVLESSILLELTISTRVEVIPGNFIDVLILDTQNVLNMTNHYVKDIGLVRSEADISYNLEDFSQFGITLPLTGNLNATSEQALESHYVAEE